MEIFFSLQSISCHCSAIFASIGLHGSVTNVIACYGCVCVIRREADGVKALLRSYGVRLRKVPPGECLAVGI